MTVTNSYFETTNLPQTHSIFVLFYDIRKHNAHNLDLEMTMHFLIIHSR